MGKIRESHPRHNAKKQVLVCFDSKPILLWFATRCRGNRKFCSLLLTVKAEARFRVKTKIKLKPLPNGRIRERYFAVLGTVEIIQQ